jgi:hypothetical protein
MTIMIQTKLPADVALLLNGGCAVEAARLGHQRSATERQQNSSVGARRMHHHELPADFMSSVLPTARPVLNVVNGKTSRRWQAVTFNQGPASNPITLLWASSDLYETRDEALEVAVLHAERSEVAAYLGRQGIISIPLDAPNGGVVLPLAKC